MKFRTTILALAGLFLSSFALNAQDIIEDTRTMSLGSNNSLTVDLPFSTDKVAEDVWKDFIKQYGGKTKKNRRENEWFTDNAHIMDINGTDNIDVYAKVNEAGSGASATVWFDLGDTFLSSAGDPDKYENAEEILHEYSIAVKKAMIEIELEEEEKELDKLESELKRLKRDLENYHKDIEQAKERIARAEANIEQNLIEQENAEKAIENQQDTVEDVKKKLSNVRKDKG